nr:uncharacterized protein LOC106680513 [Halyomorpha halys]XP_014275763.1 uncharacterized protein LOC106680513 [Halyomorpha halys]
MSFLVDVIGPKRSQSTIEESSITSEDEAVVDSENSAEPPSNTSNLQSENEGCTNPYYEPESSSPEPPKWSTGKQKLFKIRPKKKRKIDYDEELLEIENKKLSCIREVAANSLDSDFQFLTSLLPYMQEIPSHKNLKIRAELLNVLIKEQEERRMTEKS